MNLSYANKHGTLYPDTRESGRATPLLLLIAFLLGAVLASIWVKYGTHRASPGSDLSSQTIELMRHLNSPVEIRFFSVLPSGSAPETLQNFSRRVDHLLSEFQTANEAQIHVIRNLSAAGTNADAAAADGIRAFNLDKGDACFLGLTIASGERKVSLAQLDPEWESALPSDLARAILEVTVKPPAPVAKASPPASPETTNDIRQLIPDIPGTSLDDGIGILRQAAVNKIADAGAEMEKQIQAAQQQLATAQIGASAAEQQAARKHLQQVQLDEAEKLKQIAAQLQAQISVFEQMKAVAPATN